MIVSLIRVRWLTCVMVRPAWLRADARTSPMLTARLHCPIAPRAGHGVMAGTKYHSAPIPLSERSPSAGIWLPSAENPRDLPVRGTAYGRDISHSCRSPASVACCSGSIVPVVLPAPNTGLRQPHEQAAWTPPSPTSWMVVWCSTATGLLQVSDRAGQRPPHAVEGLDPGGCQLAQLVDVWRRCPRDDVVGPARRLRDARHVPQRRSHGGRLARFGLDQNVCGDHGRTTRLLRLFNRHCGDTSSRVAQAQATGMPRTRAWPKCPARGPVPGAVTAAGREPCPACEATRFPCWPRAGRHPHPAVAAPTITRRARGCRGCVADRCGSGRCTPGSARSGPWWERSGAGARPGCPLR